MSQNNDITPHPPLSTFHFVISGRVQGVFFRASTRRVAERYGVSGWVRNLPDGRVEGMASGPPGSLDPFRAWLHQGPDMAHVDNVEVIQVAPEAFNGFKIRR